MERGIEHEFEHTDDPSEAAAIACDHLEEMPDYYTRLEGMEERAREGLAPNYRPAHQATHFKLTSGPYAGQSACGARRPRLDLSSQPQLVDCDRCRRSKPYKEAMAEVEARRPPKPTRPPAGTRIKAWGGEGVVEKDQYLARDGEVMVQWDMPGRKDHGRRTAVPLDKITIIDPVERNGSPDDRYMEQLHGLIQNRAKARAIGDRPAMDTNFFGHDLDDEEIDRLSGKEGRDIDAAMDRYKTFHAKDPIRVAELDHELPTRWKPVGDALAVMYRTDKWKRDGNDEDYKHLHDKADDKPYEIRKGVRIYEPVRSGGSGLPVPRPQAVTLLGYCLGVFVRKDDDGEIYEANPRGCYLFSSPSGDMLAIYSPHEQSDGSSGFLAVMAGGNLRVLKDGIDG